MFFKFDFIPYIGITIKKEKKLTMDMRVFQIESGRVLPITYERGYTYFISFFSWS